MIAPGTWLKWYVTDGGWHPLYFRFVGRLLCGEGEAVIIDTQHGLRLNLNHEFLNHLLPLNEGERPDYLIKKVRQEHVNGELRHKGGGTGIAPPLAAAAVAQFPRLFGKGAS